jgi:hypothetical protein
MSAYAAESSRNGVGSVVGGVPSARATSVVFVLRTRGGGTPPTAKGRGDL